MTPPHPLSVAHNHLQSTPSLHISSCVFPQSPTHSRAPSRSKPHKEMRKKFRLLPRSLHQKRQFPLARSLRLTTSIRHVHNAISFSFSYLSTRTWVSIRHLVSSGTFTEYKEENFFFPPPQRKWKAKQFSCAYYLFFHSLGPSFRAMCSLSNVVTFTLMEGIVLLRRSSHGRVVLLRPFCCTSVILNVQTLLILLISSYLSIHWSISSCTNQQQRFQAVYIFFLF